MKIRARRAPRRNLTRADLIQVVNKYLMIHSVGMPTLLGARQWQRAAFIARQNKLLPEPIIRALTKHGSTDVFDPELEQSARELKSA